MDVRKTLLKAARLLAVTGAGATLGQGTANASLPPEPQNIPHTASAVTTTDLLFALLKRTNGSLSASAVSKALEEMYADPSSVEIRGVPDLLSSLKGMGASSDTLGQARALLIHRVVASLNVNDDVRRNTIDRLEALEDVSPFKLAQNEDQRRRRRREREELGQTPGGPPGAAS